MKIRKLPELRMAEAVRFELTDGCPSLVFKTSALNRSATLPATRPAGPGRRTVILQ